MKIKNFVIISHIDHGKSTLADRFLEITKTIKENKMRTRFLDMMDLEREKGITIKMRPVRMNWNFEGEDYMLNLIDTPGHVDFKYEVSRSLAAVEGGILLVDAVKGVQAQTLANLHLAQKQGLKIIPAVNKIDLANAKTEETKEEIQEFLDIPKDKIFSISAKEGTNVEDILKETIRQVPSPEINSDKPLKALIFDSEYDSYQGVIIHLRIVDGNIKPGDKINLVQSGIEGQVKEVGYFSPDLKKCKELKSGEIGYITIGLKETTRVRVGDTVVNADNENPKTLAGYKEPKPMVFASIYPKNPGDLDNLRNALDKLKLNDAALVFRGESKQYLGRGFRCGFLGSLHAEIVCERLKREFDLDLIISSPSAIYKIINQQGEEDFIYSASDWPKRSLIQEVQELWVRLEIMTPMDYFGNVSQLLDNLDAEYVDTQYLNPERVSLTYEIPLRKIVVGFFDNLKSVSQGFASMNYEILDYRPGNLIKLDILIAGKKEDAFSKIVEEDKAYDEAKKLVNKLKELIPPQMFKVPIQAAIAGKVIARATIKAYKKDVTAKLYGGDVTRKNKLLEQQKKGKKRLKEKGRVNIPSEVFLKMFKN
jgi:GTP-binding protein LepA